MILLLLSPSKLCTAPRREDPTPLTASDMNMEDNKPEKTPPEHRTGGGGGNGKKFLPEISLASPPLRGKIFQDPQSCYRPRTTIPPPFLIGSLL